MSVTSSVRLLVINIQLQIVRISHPHTDLKNNTKKIQVFLEIFFMYYKVEFLHVIKCTSLAITLAARHLECPIKSKND